MMKIRRVVLGVVPRRNGRGPRRALGRRWPRPRPRSEGALEGARSFRGRAEALCLAAVPSGVALLQKSLRAAPAVRLPV